MLGPNSSRELSIHYFTFGIKIGNKFRKPVMTAKGALDGMLNVAENLKYTKMKYCFNNCKSGCRRMRVFD